MDPPTWPGRPPCPVCLLDMSSNNNPSLDCQMSGILENNHHQDDLIVSLTRCAHAMHLGCLNQVISQQNSEKVINMTIYLKKKYFHIYKKFIYLINNTNYLCKFLFFGI